MTPLDALGRHAGPFRQVTAPAVDRQQRLAELAGMVPVATHPLEIAAALEAEGIRDAHAQELGWPDLFALAEHLFAGQARGRRTRGADVIDLREMAGPREAAGPRVTAGPRGAAAAPQPAAVARPQLTGWEVLLRGLLFALPGIAVAALLPVPMSKAEAALVLVSLGACWGLGQGMAYGGYMRVDVTPQAARRHLLAWATWCWVGLACVAAAMVLLGSVRPIVGVTATAQGGYLLAASGVMVLGGERLLLVVLLPGTLAGFARLGPPLEPWPRMWQAFGALASLLGAAGLLWRLCQLRPPRADAARVRLDHSVVAWQVLYGWCAAALVLWLPWFGDVGPGLALLMLPLVLSLGLVEWILVWLRTEGHRQLEASRSLADFQASTTRALYVAAASYLAALACLVLDGYLGLVLLGGMAVMDAGVAWAACAVVALGMFLLCAGIAVVLLGIRPVVVTAGAGVASLVASAWALPSRALGPAYAALCLALAVLSLVLARRQVRVPAHFA